MVVTPLLPLRWSRVRVSSHVAKRRSRGFARREATAEAARQGERRFCEKGWEGERRFVS